MPGSDSSEYINTGVNIVIPRRGVLMPGEDAHFCSMMANFSSNMCIQLNDDINK